MDRMMFMVGFTIEINMHPSGWVVSTKTFVIIVEFQYKPWLWTEYVTIRCDSPVR